MTAVKRTDDVLLAFSGCATSGVDACSAWSATGPTASQLERRAHELGVVRDTLFLGYQEDVAPFYAAFDALVLPSANEGTPVSAIEALAAGRPVVATRVGGVPDVVGTARTASSSSPATTTTLAERLERLARDPELRERMGARPERVARRSPRYAVERSVDDVDRLYRSLLRPEPQALAELPLRAPVEPGAATRRELRPCGALNAACLPSASAGRTASRVDVRLVAEQEPEHHVDARVRAGDRERLRQVGRLAARTRRRRAGPAVRLVAVLGDPDPLLAPEPVSSAIRC